MTVGSSPTWIQPPLSHPYHALSEFVKLVNSCSKEVLQTTIETYIARISPRVLFAETVHILLNSTAHLEGFVLGTLPKGILPTPLAPGQSLLLIWPHLTTLFAMVAVCFNEHGS